MLNSSRLSNFTLLRIDRFRGSVKVWFLGFAFCLGITQLKGQWVETEYTLQGGWNAIYLHGDADYTSINNLLSTGDGLAIEEIWRWNPNPTESLFTSSPLIPSAGTPEWSIWYRNPVAPAASSLFTLEGQAAYLVKCSGISSDTYTVTIRNRPVPPSNNWLRTGANLHGFPSSSASGSFPTFNTYFSTFAAPIAANNQIFKYIGGELGPSNPVQVFAPAFEPLDRNKAYWFESQVTGNFHGPLDVQLSQTDGIVFGQTGSVVSVNLRNRTAAPVTVTLEPLPSLDPPNGQTNIVGQVPLVLRTYDAQSLILTETPVSGSFQQVVGPKSSVEVNFGIDRSAMGNNASDFYASILRITESSQLMDVSLPVSATVASLAGLWIGDIELDAVQSKVTDSPGETVARPFPLRTLIHVETSGEARLLSQAFIGYLAENPQEQGVVLNETDLDSDTIASATRLVAAHMPLDRAIDSGSSGTNSGSVAMGQTLVRTIVIGYTDPTSPFVHQYHPDHDNLDARPDGTRNPYGEGIESYTVTRECRFTFSPAAPAGVSSLGWGSRVIGGTYTEILTGLHKETITVSGTFILRRISEIDTFGPPLQITQ